jgi:hypothetical protein
MLYLIDKSVKGQAKVGLDWTLQWLSAFDLSKVDWLRIDLGRNGNTGVYGRCWYPEKKKGYRISCQIPGPYPSKISIRKPPIYLTGIDPIAPAGCQLGQYRQATKNGITKHWVAVVGCTEVQNMDEGLVWIMGHECYHFLRKSKQIPGVNREIEADAFADELLRKFKNHE